jgi:hypothetical protein
MSESEKSDYRWPTDVDADPVGYWVRLKAWSRRHRDCPGHFCRHDEGKPCPVPPAVPKFTSCPEVSIANPRLLDCGGCDGCTPGHRCHLSGVVDYCRGSCEVPDNVLTPWADYELIGLINIRSALDDA